MGTVAEVRIARRTGFCYGVREAIDAARLSAAEGTPTHTLGQVVHNEGVIAQLRDQGIRSVHELDEVEQGAAVVIRAHGVTPDVMARAEARGLAVIDGTCSWVTQEQKELARLVEEGYTVVLLGTPNHPEVVGLLGFAPEAILVDEEEDWERIPRRKRMALLTQSHPAALEVRAPGGLPGLAGARAQDRQHGLPRHHPAAAGHHGPGPGGRPRRRGRRSQQRQHEGADAPRGHRGQAGHPGRARARPAGRGHLRGPRAGRRDGRHEHAHRGPRKRGAAHLRARGTPSTAPASRLAHEAVTAVAEPAYRSTSLGVA